jgi:NAD-dependent dihydropyrimidine dehydrogenase PreA subunit
MTQRKIVQIDQHECNGCGLCVPSCAEGAIRIIDGKAQLVAEVYCDGLGACLGHCPQGAITVVQREADTFDEEAVRQHLALAGQPSLPAPKAPTPMPQGYPGSMARSLKLDIAAPHPAMARMPFASADAEGSPSSLVNWPIQLHLVPPSAPFLKNADLVLVADCVPFAYADFHRQIVRQRPILIGCPKLDDVSLHVEKLAAIIATAGIRRLTVVHMEVPCCTGLVRIADAAKRLAGIEVPTEEITISIRGQVLSA